MPTSRPFEINRGHSNEGDRCLDNGNCVLRNRKGEANVSIRILVNAFKRGVVDLFGHVVRIKRRNGIKRSANLNVSRKFGEIYINL